MLIQVFEIKTQLKLTRFKGEKYFIIKEINAKEVLKFQNEEN